MGVNEQGSLHGNRVIRSMFLRSDDVSFTNDIKLRKDHEINDRISNLTIEWLSGVIRIMPTELDHIRIVQKTSNRFPEDKLFYTDLFQDELRIIDGRKKKINIGFLPHHTVLEVYLPQQVWNSLQITAVGGQVNIGDIHVIKCKCQVTSGSATLSGQFRALHLEMTGSRVIGEKLTADDLYLHCTSSRIDLSGEISAINSHNKGRSIYIRSLIVPKSIHSITTGAKVTISIPDNDGFALQFTKVSGHFHSDFPFTSEGNRYVYLHGKRSYKAEVRGGTFSLLKQ